MHINDASNYGATLEDLRTSVACIEIDVRARLFRVYKKDGRCAEIDAGKHVSPTEITVRRSVYFLDSNKLVLEFTHGKPAIIEMHDIGRIQKVTSKPVLYLDQCHWSTIAKAIFEPSRISQEDKEAAGVIVRLALRNEIILPISSGHLVETTSLYNTTRQNLAATMIRLSRGWQMRHPLNVRQQELLAVLTDRYGAGYPSDYKVFTLEPDAIKAIKYDPTKPPKRTKAASEIAMLIESLSSIIGTCDTLMDPERIDTELTTRWSDRYASVSQDLKNLGFTRARRRDVALGLAVVDVNEEIARASAAINMETMQLEEWITTHLIGDLKKMPFLGLYADVLDFRLSNFNTKWNPNDLIDMLYLTCAAAYADLVVAERGATNYLMQAWRQRPGRAPVVKSLPESLNNIKQIISTRNGQEA